MCMAEARSGERSVTRPPCHVVAITGVRTSSHCLRQIITVRDLMIVRHLSLKPFLLLLQREREFRQVQLCVRRLQNYLE